LQTLNIGRFCFTASVAEIEELKKEAAAFRDVRKGLNEEDGAKKTFEKVCA
jgi:hypothetical protein